MIQRRAIKIKRINLNPLMFFFFCYKHILYKTILRVMIKKTEKIL